MELKTAEKIVDKLEGQGIEASLYADYSGRGMYGRTTAGVVINSSWNTEDAKKVCRRLAKCSRDSMGLGTIFY